ncbi:MAG: hypothetical protein PVG22_17115 [Chromatiales bacterium]|jgi:hypothetical protein
MKQCMTNGRLELENHMYAGSGGISQENHSRGFFPAFYDRDTGKIELSRFANGTLAPIHLLEGLPDAWVVERGVNGMTRAIKQSVIAGFVHGGSFYTRQEAAQAMS